MGLFWTFEVIPIPITALLPLLLFPLLGIQDICKILYYFNFLFTTILFFLDRVSENYSKESNMIFLTGIIVALGLEYCNLHHRVALWAMTLVGGSSVK
jgi:sodium-dependent dicarboxylate transporter 2/3/5